MIKTIGIAAGMALASLALVTPAQAAHHRHHHGPGALTTPMQCQGAVCPAPLPPCPGVIPAGAVPCIPPGVRP